MLRVHEIEERLTPLFGAQSTQFSQYFAGKGRLTPPEFGQLLSFAFIDIGRPLPDSESASAFYGEKVKAVAALFPDETIQQSVLEHMTI